jgi:DnaJ-class molecular chaperone
MKSRRTGVCPCCKGEGEVKTVEHYETEGHGRTVLTVAMCTHCQGEGEIEIEVDE